jgi:hypothetical protein
MINRYRSKPINTYRYAPFILRITLFKGIMLTNVVFLKKIGSGTHRVAQNSIGEGVSYTDARKNSS